LELIINNPYRVLGVQSTASRKELVKRVNDLAMFAEMGKSKDFPLDLSDIFPLNRSPENIKEAERKLENDESKILYSCFWFLTNDSVDELALECLSKGDIDKAYLIWSQQIEKTQNPKFSWRLNRSTLAFFKIGKYGFDKTVLATILEDIGYIIDDYFQELKEKIWNTNPPKIDDLKTRKKIIDSFLSYIDSLPEKPYGQYKLGVIGEFWSFPQDAKNYLEAKLFTPCIELIEEKIAYAENVRDDINININQFRRCVSEVMSFEDLIYELAEFCEDFAIQKVINDYANEIRRCSVFVYNKFDEINLAESLISFAVNLPTSGQVSDDIEENRAQLDATIKEKENEQLYEHIFEHLKKEITSLFEAEKSVNFCKAELAKIQVKDGGYIEVSSVCVNVILNYLIDAFNQIREEFGENKDFDKLYTTAKKVRQIAQSLTTFTVEAKIKDRLNKNLSAINTEFEMMVEVKRKIENGEYKVTQKSDDTVVAGTLARTAEAWGWNVSFLRLVFAIGALVTYVWPAVILYIILSLVFPKKG